MSVALNEQETTISFSRDKDVVTVWTSDRTMMTKLDHLVDASRMYTCEEVARGKDGEVISKTYVIADKKKNKVTMSEARRHALAEQFARRSEFAE